MRLLVTGGAGFIGSHFVRSVLGGGYDGDRHDGDRHEGDRHDGDGGYAPESVVVLDALTYAGNRANLDPVADDPRLVFVEGDIRDAATVGPLVASADHVVHLAAESHVDRSIGGAADFVTTNVVGTQVLLDAALEHGVDRFVHVSTDEVYGSVEAGSSREDHELRPSSPYSASKAGSDLLALAYHRTHGLPVTVTRCSNNYGPYQFPEKVIPRFVTRLLDGGTVPLYGDGANVRDWLHVDDHCRGLHAVLTAGRAGAVYNIGGGTELSNRELTGRLLAATGRGWDAVVAVTDRPGHDRRYSVDTSRITAELGWAPRVSFEQGLSDTVEWYRGNRPWWEPLRRTTAATDR